MAEGENGRRPDLIDPAQAADQAVCRPDALLDVAAKMSKDLLPRLRSAPDGLLDLPLTAAGDWDVARGYGETVQRARLATDDALRFVAEQVQRIVDDLVATADAARDADQQASDAARRTRGSG
ncbi:hypothetical protein ABT294_02560 [Nonomuraea sp. NPDC000554]|uniref:hypothetical protein n=1 Tax=Nonomuraea sp. NPDC000554 TaxID=3154259 RepID=UPI0033234A99